MAPHFGAMQMLRLFTLTLVVAVVTASGFAVAHDDHAPPTPPPDSALGKCVNACGQDMLGCVKPCTKQTGDEAETDPKCLDSCRKKMEKCMARCQ